MIKRLINYYKIKVYIIKHCWLKIWTKVVYRAGHISKTLVTDTKIIKANAQRRKQ